MDDTLRTKHSLACPWCNGKTRTVETKPRGKPVKAVRRRRECVECGVRTTSIERFHLSKKSEAPAT